MHTEILNSVQKELLPYLKPFSRTFYLVGGTAIALHLGHRRSIDFDLFTSSTLVKHRIKSKLHTFPFKQEPLFEDIDQLHVMMGQVKITFFHFPFAVPHPVKVDALITMPHLLTLAAMKAFALGRRAKWKDYVDIYFLLNGPLRFKEICRESERLFKDQFSEKMFRQQLAYHKDIDYTETVEYLGDEIPPAVIQEFLIRQAIDIL